MSQNDFMEFQPNLTLLYESICIQRNDTIFGLRIYLSNANLDSIVYSSYAVKLTKSKWITTKNEDGVYTILRYVKIKPSAWFKENNGKLFYADFECKQKGVSKSYFHDGEILIRRTFFNGYHIKSIRPKENRYNLNTPP